MKHGQISRNSAKAFFAFAALALVGACGDNSAVAPAAEVAQIAAALGRHALHARVLGFEHPVTHAALRFEREPPEDFATALAALRRWAAAPAPERR